MRLEIENTLMTVGERNRLDDLASQLQRSASSTTTRDEVAKRVANMGFTPYTGGRHVAVHPIGGLQYDRLAIITHDSPDFS